MKPCKNFIKDYEIYVKFIGILYEIHVKSSYEIH